MTGIPIFEEDEELVKLHTTVFSSCVVTCAGSACFGIVKDHTVFDLAETFFVVLILRCILIRLSESFCHFCDANFVKTPKSALHLDTSKVSEHI